MPKTLQTPSRITREELYFGVARLFGERSSCPRAKVGAVAVRDRRIVATGYNGAPAGQPHCYDVGCEIVEEIIRPDELNMDIIKHCIRAVHAESNLVAFAARVGVSLKGAELYLTHTPCLNCSKLLINSGVSGVRVAESYGDRKGVELLLDSGVLVFGGSTP